MGVSQKETTTGAGMIVSKKENRFDDAKMRVYTKRHVPHHAIVKKEIRAHTFSLNTVMLPYRIAPRSSGQYFSHFFCGVNREVEISDGRRCLEKKGLSV